MQIIRYFTTDSCIVLFHLTEKRVIKSRLKQHRDRFFFVLRTRAHEWFGGTGAVYSQPSVKMNDRLKYVEGGGKVDATPA